MGLFKKTHHSPGRQAVYKAPEGYYRGNDPRICCVIRLADAQRRGYPQWVEKALAKSGGDYRACPDCWTAIMNEAG